MAMDLFEAIDTLFRKELPVDPPGDFILNRFMASVLRFAPFAKDIGCAVRNTPMAWEVWRSLVPRGRPPRMRYPAPKKQALPALVEALMQRTHLTKSEAEDAAELFALAGLTDEACRAYGVET